MAERDEAGYEREVEGAQHGEVVRVAAVIRRGSVLVLRPVIVLPGRKTVLMTVLASPSVCVGGRRAGTLVVDGAVAQHTHEGLHNGAEQYRQDSEKRQRLPAVSAVRTVAMVTGWSLRGKPNTHNIGCRRPRIPAPDPKATTKLAAPAPARSAASTSRSGALTEPARPGLEAGGGEVGRAAARRGPAPAAPKPAPDPRRPDQDRPADSRRRPRSGTSTSTVSECGRVSQVPPGSSCCALVWCPGRWAARLPGAQLTGAQLPGERKLGHGGELAGIRGA